jgi:hypothetical protein
VQFIIEPSVRQPRLKAEALKCQIDTASTVEVGVGYGRTC